MGFEQWVVFLIAVGVGISVVNWLNTGRCWPKYYNEDGSPRKDPWASHKATTAAREAIDSCNGDPEKIKALTEDALSEFDPGKFD